MSVESRNNATAKYHKENYEQINVLIAKGTKELLREKANEQGVSLNRYILEALEDKSGLKLTLDNVLPWINGEQAK